MLVRPTPTANAALCQLTKCHARCCCCRSSGGEAEGYRGSRKKSPFAGQLAAEKAAEKAMLKGVRSVRVRVKGVGRGRETALRALITSGLEVTAVEDVTPIPHNGCRPKKSRRL